jgi:hypothetical protein
MKSHNSKKTDGEGFPISKKKTSPNSKLKFAFGEAKRTIQFNARGVYFYDCHYFIQQVM